MELVTQRYGDTDRGMIEGLSDDRGLGLNKSYSYIVIISSTNRYRKHKSNMLI